jgi:hypothetical protein
MASAVLFMRSSRYREVSIANADLLADFYLQFSHRQFDVVIFGDSSCVFGVDPSVIRAVTGLSALNLCQTTSILASRGTEALDFYLAHNVRPRVLALDLAPASASIDPDAYNSDGMTHEIRYGSLPSVLMLSVERPVLALQTLLAATNTAVRGLARSIPAGHFQGGPVRAREVAASGYIPNLFAEALPEGCHERTGRRENWKRHEFIDRFRSRYAPLGIPLLVIAAPVADCDRSLPEFEKVLGSVFDNMPYSIPHALIANDGHPLHPLPPAVPGISRVMADHIQALTGTGKAGGHPGAF